MDERTGNFDLETVARLRVLEKQVRWMKKAGFLLVLCVGAVLWMGQARPVRNLEARRISLKDAKGKTRAELGMVLNRPVLTFVDETGMSTIELGVDDEGPGLVLYGKGERKTAAIVSTESGPILSLYASSGVRRLNLSVLPQGPTIGLLGPGGEAKAAFGTTGKESVYLQLFGEKERGGAQIYATGNRAALRFLDSSDSPRSVLGTVEADGTPGLILSGPGGSARAALTVTPGGPTLELSDKEKNLAWRVP
jgi:hypothetical protein